MVLLLLNCSHSAAALDTGCHEGDGSSCLLAEDAEFQDANLNCPISIKILNSVQEMCQECSTLLSISAIFTVCKEATTLHFLLQSMTNFQGNNILYFILFY